MKEEVRVYFRIGRKQWESHGTQYVVDARLREASYKPLTTGAGRTEKVLPTVAFALDLMLPSGAFSQAEKVLAELDIPEQALTPAGEVRVLS